MGKNMTDFLPTELFGVPLTGRMTLVKEYFECIDEETRTISSSSWLDYYKWKRIEVIIGSLNNKDLKRRQKAFREAIGEQGTDQLENFSKHCSEQLLYEFPVASEHVWLKSIVKDDTAVLKDVTKWLSDSFSGMREMLYKDVESRSLSNQIKDELLKRGKL